MKLLIAKTVVVILFICAVSSLAGSTPSLRRGLFVGFTFAVSWWVLFNSPELGFWSKFFAVLNIFTLTVLARYIGRSSPPAARNQHANKKKVPSPAAGAKKPDSGTTINKERGPAAGGKRLDKKIHSSARSSTKIPTAGPSIPSPAAGPAAVPRSNAVRNAVFSIILLIAVILVGVMATGAFGVFEAPTGALIADGRLIAPNLLPDIVRVEFKLYVRGSTYTDPRIYTWTNNGARQVLYEFAHHWNYSSGAVEFRGPDNFFSVLSRGSILSAKTMAEVRALSEACGGLRLFVEWAAGGEAGLISVTLEGLSEADSSFLRR